MDTKKYENMSYDKLSDTIFNCQLDISISRHLLKSCEDYISNKPYSNKLLLSDLSLLCSIQRSILKDNEKLLVELMTMRDEKMFCYDRHDEPLNGKNKVHMMVTTKPVFNPRKEQ